MRVTVAGDLVKGVDNCHITLPCILHPDCMHIMHINNSIGTLTHPVFCP